MLVERKKLKRITEETMACCFAVAAMIGPAFLPELIKNENDIAAVQTANSSNSSDRSGRGYQPFAETPERLAAATGSR